MLMTTLECMAKYGSFYRIAQAVRKGKLCRVAHGVYSDDYGLTDNVPDKIHLAVERDGTKIKDANVIEYFVPRGTGEIGVVNTVLHGIGLRIFDKERLLIETMRMRTKKIGSWPYLQSHDRILNASVEVNNYEPVTLAELIANNQRYKTQHPERAM